MELGGTCPGRVSYMSQSTTDVSWTCRGRLGAIEVRVTYRFYSHAL